MAEAHYYEQKDHAHSYLIPFFQRHLPNFKNLSILEVGCAEAGFLDALYDLGIDAMGLELEIGRVKIMEEKNPMLKVVVGDITDDKIAGQIGKSFDLIVIRDVIEHIHDKMTAFSNIDKLLKNNGYLYMAFPPKFSAFAGHQQHGRSVLRFFPYLHLLPEVIIRLLGRVFRERPGIIDRIVLNYHIGLSIQSFEKYYSMFNFEPLLKELFLFRPIYKIRYGLKPIKIPSIPLIREFIAFGCECLLKKP